MQGKLRMRRRTLMLIVAIVVGAAALLLSMGRPPICTCGTVKLWEGAVNSAGNSQHIADWYSFSHIIHGFIFYALSWWLLRSWLRTDTRLALSVLIEAGGARLENSPPLLDPPRTATLAFGYSGDSVLNSMSDIAMMTVGFLFALKMPARVTVAVAIGFELMTLYTIRDNLTLNVLMLTWPIEAVKTWQAGG